MIRFIKIYWWRILAILLILYSIIWGFLIDVPDLPIIYESIRNVFYHVGMWLVLIFMMLLSLFFSLRYLSFDNIEDDNKASVAAATGLLFGFLGILTGMIWARYTWGSWWVRDPQLNGAVVAMMAYMAYFLLRSSMPDEIRAAKLSAVYNILSFIIMFVFIGVLPRLSMGSLHPGSTSEPGMSIVGMNAAMRQVFYPALLGWILIGLWIWDLGCRYRKLKNLFFEEYE